MLDIKTITRDEERIKTANVLSKGAVTSKMGHYLINTASMQN
jgi:hypothetical protein